MRIFKHQLSISFALVCACLGALFIASPVSAEEDANKEIELQVSPTTVNVTMQGGEVIEGDSDTCTTVGEFYGCHVELQNNGSAPLNVRVYVTPYSITTEDNEANFTDDDYTYTQIARWLKLDDGNGNFSSSVKRTINPGESISVPFRITVPEDIPGGMQRAVIWAEAENSGNRSGGLGINANPRAAISITGRSIGDVRQTSEITDYGFDRFKFSGPLTAHATVKNTGNTDFTINSYYTVKTLFGKVLEEKTDATAAYPEVEYHLNMNWENTPYLGIFLINYKISTGSSVKDETHVAMILPIPILLLIILLLTIIIIWIIIIIRKRQERKARMLV